MTTLQLTSKICEHSVCAIKYATKNCFYLFGGFHSVLFYTYILGIHIYIVNTNNLFCFTGIRNERK